MSDDKVPHRDYFDLVFNGFLVKTISGNKNYHKVG